MILLAVFVMLCMATGCGKSGKAPYEATMSKVFMCDDAYTGSIIAINLDVTNNTGDYISAYTPVYEMQGVAGSRWPFLVTGEDSFRLACSQWKYVGEGIQFYEYDYNNLIYDIYMSAFIIPKQTGGAWIPIAETMVRARFSHLYQVEYDLNYPGGAAAGSTVQASFKDNLTYLALPVLTEPADAERYEQIGWEITGTDIIPYQTGSGLYDAGSIRVSGVPTEAVQ